MTGLFLSLGFMFVVLSIGVWIAIALGISGSIGLAIILGWDTTIKIIGRQLWVVFNNEPLIAAPLFIFMGHLLYTSGITERLYRTFATLLAGYLPGRLIQTNIATCTFFAACSGSSVASAATIGGIAYPYMSKIGYDKSLVIGSIAAGGTLGILIPPSINMIIYCAITAESVGRLFMGGLFPGLIMAALFGLYIAIRCLLNPGLTPSEGRMRAGFKDMVLALLSLWEVILLAGVVLVPIYVGIATPTEVAALGAFGAMILMAARRQLTLRNIRLSLFETIKTTCMVMFIIFGAKIMALCLGYYHFSPLLKVWVESQDFSPMAILVGVIILYLILGMFFDAISMMVVTIPFVVPLVLSAGFDAIWFGVFFVILSEIGLLTPPVGINLFVLQGVTGEKMITVVRGSAPFVPLQILVMIMLIIWPSLSLWLPSKMLG